MQDTPHIVISSDRLSAFVIWPTVRVQASEYPTAEAILAACDKSGIPRSEPVARQAAATAAGAVPPFAGQNDEGQSPEVTAFLISAGTPPREAVDASFEWSEAVRPAPKTDTDGRIDPFSVDAIVTVTPGTIIGRIVPAVAGADGTDVFGRPRPPRRARGEPMALGGGVSAGDAGAAGQVVATTAGRVLEERHRVSVVDVLEVGGDVDFESGSINSQVDVVVRGTIRAKFHVHTQGSLTVWKAIEAADVEAAGDIVVHGGVFGGNHGGHVKAGGSIRATLLNEAMVRSGASITFSREILSSDVHAEDRITAESGTIIGGKVYARNGVAAAVLGSDAGAATSIAIGYAIEVLRQARDLEKEMHDRTHAAGQIRDLVAPLLQNLKRLTPAQRERATELLSKADELETRVDELRTTRDKLLSDHAPIEGAAIVVRETVNSGVHVRIGPRAAVVRRPIPGPLRIELRKVDDVNEIAVVNPRTGSVTVLPSTEVDLGPSTTPKA